jgi:two-component system chemotaxis response regulator CheB
VIGASAGGIEALTRLVAALPRDLPAAVFVVVHTHASAPGRLPAMLERAGPLPARLAVDGEGIERGCILVAPPDHHLMIERDRVRVVHGPRENRNRPAVDILFRSAAWAYGPRVTGIVLSGALDDGTAGLWAIKTCLGVTVVQEPEEAAVPDMPRHALSVVDVDHCLPVAEIAALIVRLARTPVNTDPHRPARLGTELEYARQKRTANMDDMNTLGKLSMFTCPTCRGALWELKEGGLRYRCHTGHAFSKESMLEEQSMATEHALYSALATVEERSALLRHLVDTYGDSSKSLAKSYRERMTRLDETAVVLRRLLSGETSLES